MNELSFNDIKRFKLSVGTRREVRSSIDTQRRAYAGKGGRGVFALTRPVFPSSILPTGISSQLITNHHAQYTRSNNIRPQAGQLPRPRPGWLPSTTGRRHSIRAWRREDSETRSVLWERSSVTTSWGGRIAGQERIAICLHLYDWGPHVSICPFYYIIHTR